MHVCTGTTWKPLPSAQVRATVRDASKQSKHAHLLALADALPGTLELHSANLLAVDAFDELVR